MGRIVIAAFRPHLGKDQELVTLVRERLTLLRQLGMATDRPNITMRAQDGTVVDVSEWTDDGAIVRAHKHPDVLALWDRFEACSEYVPLHSIEEAMTPFSTFTVVDA